MQDFIPPVILRQTELGARSIAKASSDRLKASWGMREIDNSHFWRCPRCGKLPTVLLNDEEGVVRCCDLATVVVNLPTAGNPVSDGTLAYRWSELVQSTIKEKIK